MICCIVAASRSRQPQSPSMSTIPNRQARCCRPSACGCESARGSRPVGTGGMGGTCLGLRDRKSTRLNSSHVKSSYAVFCLKKKKKHKKNTKKKIKKKKNIKKIRKKKKK